MRALLTCFYYDFYCFWSVGWAESSSVGLTRTKGGGERRTGEEVESAIWSNWAREFYLGSAL